jgi:capsular exopolysaccharide synthesis family protein
MLKRQDISVDHGWDKNVEPYGHGESFENRREWARTEVKSFVTAKFDLARCPKIELPKEADGPLVTGQGSFMVPVLEAYKSLRTRLISAHKGRGVRSVAVTSAALGDGKTLTTFNLACCCARMENMSVLLVDADLRVRGLTKLIGSLPPVGLADLLAGVALPESVLVQTDLPNLAVLGAGQDDISGTELFSSAHWRQFMDWATEAFELVLVDSPPVGVVADSELIAAECNGVLLVVRALRTRREAVKGALDLLGPEKVIGVVWNGAENSNKSYYYSSR